MSKKLECDVCGELCKRVAMRLESLYGNLNRDYPTGIGSFKGLDVCSGKCLEVVAGWVKDDYRGRMDEEEKGAK